MLNPRKTKVQSLLVTRVNFKRSEIPRFQLARLMTALLPATPLVQRHGRMETRRNAQNRSSPQGKISGRWIVRLCSYFISFLFSAYSHFSCWSSAFYHPERVSLVLHKVNETQEPEDNLQAALAGLFPTREWRKWENSEVKINRIYKGNSFP